MATTSDWSDTRRYKLIFFAPPLSLPNIKTALFDLDAGKLSSSSKYSEVCFTTPGIGQFKPGPGAAPTLGEVGKLEEVGEVRCEMVVVGEHRVKACVSACRRVHPYEEAVVEVMRLEDF
ncbi:MAG: hypothetical protein M1828_004798 [Chrysothrix sp. TS-e1954]|nr:MAG: hypothetical protein M1828_004798 [Chrysothrix sp. TS-e1954]